MENKNRYQSLMSNTFIFALSTISSKLMVFLLMPLYTRLLSPADYAVMDIIVQTSNLLTPLVFVSISEAVIRYCLDASIKKHDVYTIGISTCIKGSLLFLLALPLLSLYELTSSYTLLIYFYVVSSCFRGVVSQFTRGIGLVRLYAFDSVFATLNIIILNIILMVGFKLGVTGYILSIVLSNFLSIIFLTTMANLNKYLILGKSSRRVSKQMIKYSAPLIPTTIFWWVINVSDRYIVNFFLGETITGLYSTAYKIPTIIFLISSIFTQAWQLSAISEYSEKDKDAFYSKIFSMLSATIFTAASGIILLLKPITYILVAPDYYPSLEYAPTLVLALIFSCFSTFYSSFYMASKQNKMSLITTMIGAFVNLALNFILIPIMGALGAAVATLISYMAVYLLRAVDTRRFVKLKVSILTMALNIAALGLQVVASTLSVNINWLVQLLLTVFIILLNLKPLLDILVMVIEAVQKKRKKK